MGFLKFAHVENDHPFLASEEKRRKFFGGFGLSGSGRSGENHRSKRFERGFVGKFSREKARYPLFCPFLPDYRAVKHFRKRVDDFCRVDKEVFWRNPRFV